MNNLHDAINNLYRQDFYISDFNINELYKVERKLDRKADKPPPKFALKELLAKFLSGAQDFSPKELKNLPFIIYENACSNDDVTKILNLMEFSRERHLKNLVNAYFMNYDESDKTKLLRQFLRIIFSSNHNYHSRQLNQIYDSREYFFYENCFDNMVKAYSVSADIAAALNNVGIADWLKSSNFVKLSLMEFFKHPTANIKTQIDILIDVDKNAGVYESIIPAIADGLIPTVESSIDNRIYAKKICTDIFYKHLGDPRFGNNTRKWDNISHESRNIFQYWLNEDDLNLFFKIIEQTAVDYMWRYRKKFWQAYLPAIRNTRVFLGKNAERLAIKLNDTKMHWGRLKGGESAQSVFIFQIGQYIFAEWSHNGKLRVYEFNSARDFLSRNEIERFNMQYAISIAEWVHSSPETYSWQGRVSKWLGYTCNIHKDYKDWGGAYNDFNLD